MKSKAIKQIKHSLSRAGVEDDALTTRVYNEWVQVNCGNDPYTWDSALQLMELVAKHIATRG